VAQLSTYIAAYAESRINVGFAILHRDCRTSYFHTGFTALALICVDLDRRVMLDLF
jgi:hypothetical protein